jgi:hypothetical protein
MGALVEISEVVLATPMPPGLGGGYLDQPRPGAVIDAGCVDILGWALGAEVTAVAAEFSVDGDLVWRAPLRSDRPDVEEAFPEHEGAARAGFATTLDLIGKRPELELGVTIVLGDERRARLATIRGRRRWRRERSSAFADLVSVAIPASDGIEAAVEDVLSQTHPQIEPVLLGGGPEGAESEIAARFPDLTWVAGEGPLELTDAWNLAIRSSNGDYLVLLSPGQRLSPTAIEAGVRALDRHPACAAVLAGEGGDRLAPSIYRRSLFEHVRGFDPALGADAEAQFDLTVASEFAVCRYEKPVSSPTADGE